MDNVKFVRYERYGANVDLYFKLCERLAYNVRQNTQYNEEKLLQTLSSDNLFKYTISCSDYFDDIIQSLIAGIERVSNESDDEYFYNHVLTDKGYHRAPQEIHKLMCDEYGFADVDDDEDEESQKAADLEWWTAHFFIHLGNVMLRKGSKKYTESIAISRQGVDVLLDIIKDIDIVVVDDARTAEIDEIKKHLAELKGKT